MPSQELNIKQQLLNRHNPIPCQQQYHTGREKKQKQKRKRSKLYQHPSSFGTGTASNERRRSTWEWWSHRGKWERPNMKWGRRKSGKRSGLTPDSTVSVTVSSCRVVPRALSWPHYMIHNLFTWATLLVQFIGISVGFWFVRKLLPPSINIVFIKKISYMIHLNK